MIELQMSSYARQYYVFREETRDQVTTNYQTRDSQLSKHLLFIYLFNVQRQVSSTTNK